MLSRLVFRSKSLWMTSRPLVNQVVRPVSQWPRYEVNSNPPLLPELVEETEGSAQTYHSKTQSLEDFLDVRFGPEMVTINDDKSPERDVKNYPRLKAPEWPDRTRLYILPASWFDSFYHKTGVTGPYVFFGAFTTFLLSKEWLVLDHEYVTGQAIVIWTAIIILKFGPQIREFYCKWQDAEVGIWDEWQKGMKDFLHDMIESENVSQEMAKQYKILFDTKRENIKLQLEAEFRRRQMSVFSDVRNRLEYMLAKQVAQRQYQQKHMVEWIIDSVLKGITPQQEKDFLQKCLSDLKQLSTKHKISLT